MTEEEVIEWIKKNNFKHKQCCMTWNSKNRSYCAYWKIKVDPNQLGCTIFNTCDKCLGRKVNG